MNLLTSEVFSESGHHGQLLQALWLVCIVYDYYTTLMGLANMTAGAGVFSISTMNILDIVSRFTAASIVFLLVGSTILVASPMMAYWLWKKSALAKST